jgi:hypothetical protein
MVIDHDVVIDVKSNVQITRLNPLTPSITRCFFSFVDFAYILTTRKGSRMLTGKKNLFNFLFLLLIPIYRLLLEFA